MKSRTVFLYVILFRIILESSYIFIVAPMYSYYGLVWEPSISKLLFSYFIFFILFLLLPKGEYASHKLVFLFFLTTVVPLLSFTWQANQDLTYPLMVSFCCFIIFTILRKFRINMKIIVLKQEVVFGITRFIFIISAVLLVGFTLRYGGIDARTLNFSQIYELRSELRYTGIWRYLVNWLGKLLIPFCIVMYLYRRNMLMFILSCFMQIYFYLSTGEKTLLFSVLLITISSYLLSKSKWYVGMPLFYSLSIFTSSTIYFFMKYLMVVAIVPVRVFNIPSAISFAHYDFFSVNPKLYFSEGLIGKLFGIERIYQIGSTYLVSVGSSNANTGIFADAYDNGGFILMIIIALLFSLILMSVDSICKFSKKPNLYTNLMVYTVIVLNNGGLLTALMTWGLGLLLVFMYLSSSEEYSLRILNEKRKSGNDS